MNGLFPGKDLQNWKDRIHIMREIRVLAETKPAALTPRVGDVVRSLSEWLSSLRSQVSRDAITCFSELFKQMGPKMVINKSLLKLVRLASTGDKGFIAKKAKDSIDLAIKHVSSRRVAVLLLRNASTESKSAAYRGVSMQVLREAVEAHTRKKGDAADWGIGERDLKRMIAVVSEGIVDGSPLARTEAKRLLQIMDTRLGGDAVVDLSMRTLPMGKHMSFMRNYSRGSGLALETASGGRIDTPRPKRRARPRTHSTKKKKKMPRKSSISTVDSGYSMGTISTIRSSFSAGRCAGGSSGANAGEDRWRMSLSSDTQTRNGTLDSRLSMVTQDPISEEGTGGVITRAMAKKASGDALDIKPVPPVPRQAWEEQEREQITRERENDPGAGNSSRGPIAAPDKVGTEEDCSDIPPAPADAPPTPPSAKAKSVKTMLQESASRKPKLPLYSFSQTQAPAQGKMQPEIRGSTLSVWDQMPGEFSFYLNTTRARELVQSAADFLRR